MACICAMESCFSKVTSCCVMLCDLYHLTQGFIHVTRHVLVPILDTLFCVVLVLFNELECYVRLVTGFASRGQMLRDAMYCSSVTSYVMLSDLGLVRKC